jgi:hypothetical protein
MVGDRVVSSFLAQGIVAEQGTRRTYGSADPSRREAEHAGGVSVNENGLLTEMVTDRDTATRVVAHREDAGTTEVGGVTAAAP